MAENGRNLELSAKQVKAIECLLTGAKLGKVAKAVGVEPEIVHVPMEIARRARPPLLHWGEALVGGAMFSIDAALRDLDWEPSFGLLDGYADAYRWFTDGGREQFDYDFSTDESLLAQLS